MTFVSVLALAVALALGPTIIYALLLWWLDRYEKEPLPLLLTAFMWGAVPAIVLALLFEVVAGVSLRQVVLADQTREITEAGLIAPIVEEAVKAVILVVLFLAYRSEFDNVLDGVIYGAMVGLGFALVENVLYLTFSAYSTLSPTDEPDVGRMLGLWVFRAGLFGLNHSMFTGFTGAALGFARSVRRGWLRGFVTSLGLGAAMLFHSVHNSLATVAGLSEGDEARSVAVLGACVGIFVSDWGGLVFILVVALASAAREGQVIKQTLWEEVALGRLTRDEYETLMSARKRSNARWSILFASGFRRWRQVGRFFDLATELAFRKHRLNDADPILRSICADDIVRLRGEIDHLKSAIIAAGTGKAGA